MINLLQYQNDIKKPWNVNQEKNEEAKSTKCSFPKIMIIDGQEIFDQGKIASCFNNLIVDVGPKLALMIPESQTKLTSI